MSKVLKNLQWIPDDYVFGSTLESLFNPKYNTDYTKGLRNKTGIVFSRSGSKQIKLPIVKHLQRVCPEANYIRVKLASLNQRYSEKNLPLATVIEFPRKKSIKKN
ncbi:hypothetical protein SteCoe_22770 [Stentor coeruleus]|uniref:Uncharacterized protein n=1 Tax=Stentor coeruleus TaxID=5963 RepID=A0A1R2BLI1_9CILI|nr:hypothetical protein SteCoe_22770 [Stentor coeruleus]